MKVRKMKRLLAVLPLIALALITGCSQGEGRLDLHIFHDGEATPARIELLGEDGEAWIPPDALPLSFECGESPPPEWLWPGIENRSIHNLFTGTTQSYAAGHASLALPQGRYTLRVYKGNEFRVARRTIEISAGATHREDVDLERWVSPAAEGWIGSDDHIHITRERSEQNSNVLAWMRAEGMAVANLLQMGTADQFDVTPQYAFGDAGVYGEGETRLFAGQEHPRTHLLGHTITLAAREAIDLRDRYIVFDSFWRESERLGGVSGFAHYGQGPAQDGLAISAPTGRIHFVEVLQQEYLAHRVWYELLDMGMRIAPSAGTDWPCISGLPGRERVYVGIDGALTRASFVQGLRARRTFVTNGPILEMHVEDAAIGDVIELDAPASIHVEARVRFDPERDHVREMELVVGGKVVRVAEPGSEPGVLTLSADVPIRHTTWIALRTMGDKLDEIPYVPQPIPDWAQGMIDWWGGGWSFEGRDEFMSGLELRPSIAHTGAVFVEVDGLPNPAAAVAAQHWIERLDDFAARIAEDRIEDMSAADRFPYSDAVSVEHVRQHRDDLMRGIEQARAHYGAIIARSPSQ